MQMTEQKIKLFVLYADTLKKRIEGADRIGGDREYKGLRYSPPEVAWKMFHAIERGGNSQWMKYNPALKQSAAQLGIKTEPELRKFIKEVA